jgi:uncharacterized membrane protein
MMATDYTSQVTTTADADRLDGLRKLDARAVRLYAFHWLTGGVTGIIAIIINYVKRDDVGHAVRRTSSGRSARSGGRSCGS